MGKLEVICGDIVSDDILACGDAIVLLNNPMMRCGAGVSGAIFKKTGVDELRSMRFSLGSMQVKRTTLYSYRCLWSLINAFKSIKDERCMDTSTGPTNVL